MGRRYIRAKDEMDSRGRILLEWRRSTSVETAKVEASEAGAFPQARMSAKQLKNPSANITPISLSLGAVQARP